MQVEYQFYHDDCMSYKFVNIFNKQCSRERPMCCSEALWTRELPKIRTKNKPQIQWNGTQAVPYGHVYFTVYKIFTRAIAVQFRTAWIQFGVYIEFQTRCLHCIR